MNNKDNQLIIRIQPDEGILIKIWGKSFLDRAFTVERANLVLYSNLADSKCDGCLRTIIVLDAMQGDARPFFFKCAKGGGQKKGKKK